MMKEGDATDDIPGSKHDGEPTSSRFSLDMTEGAKIVIEGDVEFVTRMVRVVMAELGPEIADREGLSEVLMDLPELSREAEVWPAWPDDGRRPLMDLPELSREAEEEISP